MPRKWIAIAATRSSSFRCAATTSTFLPARTWRKRLQRYEIPELVGSRQALGSQLIDGRLRQPILDYISEQGPIHQRLSIFEGGLVVVDAHGAGGIIRKKLLIPDDALKNYVKSI